MASCAKMVKLDISHSKVFKLDVGGKRYKTSLATLLIYPHSYLGKLFSGKFELSTNEDGEYFIDANGDMFRYILDFLRRSKLTLPDGFKEFDLLCLEADFFQIEPLIQALELLKNEREVIRNEIQEWKKKKILTIWGRFAGINAEFTLKVSYLQKPGGSFEQMKNMNTPSDYIGHEALDVLETCFSDQGYTKIVHLKKLSSNEIEAYLYTYGITTIPKISEISELFQDDLTEEYILDVWSKD